MDVAVQPAPRGCGELERDGEASSESCGDRGIEGDAWGQAVALAAYGWECGCLRVARTSLVQEGWAGMLSLAAPYFLKLTRGHAFDTDRNSRDLGQRTPASGLSTGFFRNNRRFC
jgi:hypothetical protein